MSFTTGRSAARRARVARQFLQVHDRLSQFMERRQAPFWSRVAESIMADLSRAHSEHIYIDQIFRPAEWRSLFNAALLPAVKTTVHAGVSFEAEWVHSATGEATRQAASWLSGRSELQSIQQWNFSCGIQEDFFGQGEGSSITPFPGRSSGPRSGLLIQRGMGPNPNLPSIDVALSDQMAGDIGRFLETRSVGVWAKVGSTTKKALEETIRRGLREGDSLKNLTDRIQGTLTHYSKHEARRVARTETTAAMNFGQHAERGELGIEHKEWVSTIDARTRGVGAKDRFDHLSAAGQTTRNDVPFVVSAESLMFPGDTTLGASAGNVIHCRCCAVGAWPENTLTGGLTGGLGGGPSSKPATPARMSPEDSISYSESQKMVAEQASPEIKKQVRQIAALLKKHDEKLEKARKEVVAIEEKINKAKAAVLTQEQEAAKINEQYWIAESSGDKGESRRLKKELAAINKKVDRARANVGRIVRGQRDAVNRAIRTGVRPDIEFTFADDVTDEMKSNAVAAAKFVKAGMDNRSTGRMHFHVQLANQEDPRANYDSVTRTLNMDYEDKIQTYVHEMGHGIEDYGYYQNEAKAFLHYRTQNDMPTVLRKKFPSANPKLSFGPHEVAFEDEFFRAFGQVNTRRTGAYVGKYYRNGTEILSMGIELLYNDPVGFAQRDPEFFKFIVGIMRGLIRLP